MGVFKRTRPPVSTSAATGGIEPSGQVVETAAAVTAASTESGQNDEKKDGEIEKIKKPDANLGNYFVRHIDALGILYLGKLTPPASFPVRNAFRCVSHFLILFNIHRFGGHHAAHECRLRYADVVTI